MNSKTTFLVLIIISCSFYFACIPGNNRDAAYLNGAAVYELESARVSTADDEPRIVKITVSLRYPDSNELKEELSSKGEEMQHVVNILLQGKSYREMDSAGDKKRLAEEIKDHINIRLTNGKISDVIIKEMVLD